MARNPRYGRHKAREYQSLGFTGSFHTAFIFAVLAWEEGVGATSVLLPLP